MQFLMKNFDIMRSILLNRSEILFWLVCLLLTSCETEKKSLKIDSEIVSKLQLPDRPNILWLVTEDLGPYIPPFGDSTIQTPI